MDYNNQNMNDSDYKINISNLIKRYICIEKQLNSCISRITRHYCCHCHNTCCREDICRETIDSAFLQLLVKKQNRIYNVKEGWMSPAGCRLSYGRPLVCYEFFCEKIMMDDNFKNSCIDKLIKAFASAGQRAYKGQHLIAIQNIRDLSNSKAKKINDSIMKISQKANIFLQPSRFLRG